jgi:transcriptional regulator GlxA family with amidase domain
MTKKSSYRAFKTKKSFIIQIDENENIVLIISFTTNNINDTLYRNQFYIPWLQNQYKSGAEMASFCIRAFLFGATGFLIFIL